MVVAQAATGERIMRDEAIESKLSDLTRRLTDTFGEQLISVVLYGSGAGEDWNQNSSDLNILCVLRRISPEELRQAEPIVQWWRESGNPSPLLLTEEEVQTSTDCFPMEFRDMQHHRRVLHGPDLIEDLVIDNKFYRAQVEHELRAKHLRLRQRAAEVLSQPERLQRLMTDSVSTFCVLGRHALILHGSPAHWKKSEIVRALSTATGSPLHGLDEILAIRTSGKQASASETTRLLERYLDDVSSLVRFVDVLTA